MHSACLAICKMNKLHKIIGQNIEHEQVIECFHQPLIMELHCTGMILCRPFWNSFLQMISHLFVLKGFQFSIHQQIISYSCNYFFQWVKCMRLKKSDLFRILLLVALELSLHLFCSDLSYFFQKPEHKHFFFGQKNLSKTTRPPQTYISWPRENWTIMNAAVSGCLRSRNVLRLGLDLLVGGGPYVDGGF